MLLKFCKMHGLGNDFVVLESLRQNVRLSRSLVRKLADRHKGVGCDQLLLIESPSRPDMDFKFRYFNSDGEEIEQCGNGLRCMARFLQEEKLIGNKAIKVQTVGDMIELRINGNGSVTADMGIPNLEPAEIPFAAPHRSQSYQIDVDGQEYQIFALSLGNPHAVLQVEDLDKTDVKAIGSKLECHPRFTNKVNVGFMQINNRRHVRLRVFERGVGETAACGTGACAAAVVGVLQQKLDSSVCVSMPGGELTIDWSGEGKVLTMTGPAVKVFDGYLKI